MVHNRKINLGDRAFLALYEISLIAQPDFVADGEPRAEELTAAAQELLSRVPYHGRNGHFKNKFAHSPRERDKRSEIF